MLGYLSSASAAREHTLTKPSLPKKKASLVAGKARRTPSSFSLSSLYKRALNIWRHRHPWATYFHDASYWRDLLLHEIRRHADPRALNDCPADNVRLRRTLNTSSHDASKWRAAARSEVSIVLATYNRLDALKLTIESIRNNGFTAPYEIIVVDGGSTDGTVDWLSKQKDILLLLQHNRDDDLNRRRSWGYFMNLGFKLAEAPWILMLSDDCLLLNGSIENSLSYARQLESQGRTIGGLAYYFRNWPMDERYFVQHTIGGMLMVNHGLFSKQALMDVNYANEDDYSFYKADSDLSLKLWWNEYEIVDCRNAIVEHLVLPSEQLRTTNTQSMNDDRLTMINRWKGIYVYPELDNLFKTPGPEFIDFVDQTRAAEAFRPLLEHDKTQADSETKNN